MCFIRSRLFLKHRGCVFFFQFSIFICVTLYVPYELGVSDVDVDQTRMCKCHRVSRMARYTPLMDGIALHGVESSFRLRSVALRHVMSCHIMSWYVMSRPGSPVLCTVVSWCVELCAAGVVCCVARRRKSQGQQSASYSTVSS